MLLELNKSEENIYIEGDKSTKHISSKFSIVMNSKKIDKLILNKFAPSIILQTYLPNHCPRQHLKKIVYDTGMRRIKKLQD